MKIDKGNPIPAFSGIDENGNIVSSETIKGKKTILFFYPKDDSPGCTKEACNLRDNYNLFKKNGYTIFGISPDTDKKHKKFIDKYEFPYSLIADPEKEIINAFGLWGPKKFMGKDIVGVYRTTVVTDENGIVTEIIDKVKTDDHSAQLANALGLN
ncbi:MAG: thioredoxin-dependent thiol peroxidase [Saprospiraceae bacterium]|nr:thioredoxin-dependent thiol peroxidase [Saprospiraceae bacterium]